MRYIWACSPEGCQGTDVQRALEPEHPSALTTILTTLDRLLTKGIVRREREGKAYRYWAVYSEEQLQQRIVEGVMDRLIAQFPKAVAAYFAQQGRAGDETESDLSDLARRVGAAGNRLDASASDAQPSNDQAVGDQEADARENERGR